MASSSKKKEKEKKSSKKDKKEKSSGDEDNVSNPVPPVLTHEFEAKQLFQRYDRTRTGSLNKYDFQQLVMDVNSRPSLSHYPQMRLDPNTTLTEHIGIPMGYEKTTKNTEFEAGQLFERYDKAHKGVLDILTFLQFFHDFQAQLLPFYHQLYLTHDLLPFECYGQFPKWNYPIHPTRLESNQQDPLFEEYTTKLHKLQSLFNYSLEYKKKQMIHRMMELRDIVNNQSGDRVLPFATELNKLEENLKRLERYGHELDTKLSLGNKITIPMIQQFLQEYPKIFEFLETILHGTINSDLPPPTSPCEKTLESKYTEALRTLKIKDQVIWELVQERDHLRKQNHTMIQEMQQLSERSTHEMSEWARLTDDLAAELGRFRNKM